MFFGFDWTFIVLVIPALILSLWAQARVRSVYRKYACVEGSRRISGAQAARRVLDEHGLSDVAVRPTRGELSDHFDPRDGCVYLSEGVYGGTSVAAVGIACHECGHAIQHAEGYAPLSWRTALVPVVNIGSKLAFPLILAGVILTALLENDALYFLTNLGLIAYSLATVFQLVTLPTEFNASSRALRAITETGLLEAGEIKGAQKVLSAAALTYVAALAASAIQLLRMILIFGRRRD